MRKGKIESVNCKKDTGKIGGEITVVVRKKDFAVREVAVSLSTVDGGLIEKGLAVRKKDGSWVYRNTVAVRDAGAVVLQVRAIDVNERWWSDTAIPILTNLGYIQQQTDKATYFTRCQLFLLYGC